MGTVCGIVNKHLVTWGSNSPDILRNGRKVWLKGNLADQVSHAVCDALKGWAIDDDLPAMTGLRLSLYPLSHLASVLFALADLIHLYRQTNLHAISTLIFNSFQAIAFE